MQYLILIVLGEVKVDLANFDVKFPTKFLGTGFKKKYLFLWKRLPNLFELMLSKNGFCHIFFRSLAAVPPLPALPLPLTFGAITDHPEAGESCRAVLCSLAWRQSRF